MKNRRSPRIHSRKSPKQVRSNDLVAAILQAAIQVLTEEGAQRFTTTRVAERAGVSIGSLYQYFPSRESILFRLQSDEWRCNAATLSDILKDEGQPALMRLNTWVHTFLRSECQEAVIRAALADAAPLYRETREAKDLRTPAALAFAAFIRQSLPHSTAATCEMVVDLMAATLSHLGKRFSTVPRTSTEIETYANAIADMFGAYLQKLSPDTHGA